MAKSLMASSSLLFSSYCSHPPPPSSSLYYVNSPLPSISKFSVSCNALPDQEYCSCSNSFSMIRRRLLALSCPILLSAATLIPLLSSSTSFTSTAALAAILEADDDLELLERVKKDRKKRLEKQEVINSSKIETAYLQDLVYKLSKVGQAIDKEDLPMATAVLGTGTEKSWVKNVNSAFEKFTSSSEEKKEVEAFNSSLVALISSVVKNDPTSSKTAFVSSATAFEKWTALTGVGGLLKGL